MNFPQRAGIRIAVPTGMQPNNTNRPTENSTRDQSDSLDNTGDNTGSADSQPMISSDPLAMGNTRNVGPSVASRAAGQRTNVRSPASWAVPLILLVGLAIVLFIAFRPRPVDNGNVRGVGDESTRNTLPDTRR